MEEINVSVYSDDAPTQEREFFVEYFVFPVFYSVKGGQYLNGRNLYWRIRHR